MLEKMHLGFDARVFKCWFSSIMKRKLAHVLGAPLIAILIHSCASYGPYEATNDYKPVSPSSTLKTPRDSEKTKPAEDRPGLATGWGREIESEYHVKPFVRASSKPAGTDVIYYNDREGIKAMSSYKERVSPMQTAAGGLVEWGIRGGVSYLPSYKEGGYGRRYVAGENNGTYSIVVKNRCKSALEIVASVDGLDVQDGKSAAFTKRGYFVEPGKTIEIQGFRTSYRTVAAFKFSSVANSYANMRHGNTRNVGVIGLAVFTQKNVDPWTWMPSEIHTRETANPFSTAP
jgi:hypothetical protein